jgi:hypothetical protein
MHPRLLFGLLLVTGCAPRSLQTGPALGTAPTVHVWKTDLEDNSNSSLIQARNDGSSPVVITELRLYSCTNLYQSCGTHQLSVRVEPGQTVLVARLDPSNHAQRPRFGWEYRWRGIAPPPATLGTTSRQTFREVSLDRLIPLVAGIEANPVCDAPPQSPNPGEASYGMRFSTSRSGLPERLVAVRVDAQRQVTHYSESRGDLRVAPPGVTPPRPVTDPGDRTSFTIDPAAGVAILTNQPAGAAPEQLLARGGTALLDAPTLGHPRTVAQRILSECAR